MSKKNKQLVEVTKIEATTETTKELPTIEIMNELGYKSKSAQIRHLDLCGFDRSTIAKHLNIRYQHVRNVLITPLKRVIDNEVTK